jgi:serine/threonine protein kinase
MTQANPRDRGKGAKDLVDGRYRLLERVGSGGMADVHCAEDLRLGRKVAIKLLRRQLAQDREHVERFRREACSAARLRSSHDVSVYDRG